MDAKTKSIIIGLSSAFAAVLIIVLLFFSISGISNGNGSEKKNKKDNAQVVSVDSDGNIIVIVEDDDDDEDGGSSADPVSSEENKTDTPAIFGRSDIDGITGGKDSFSQLVKAVNPSSYEWNTDNIKATSEVEVKLIAYDGSYAVIGVPYEAPDYTIDGEIVGSGSDITEWDIYGKCKKEKCRVKEIVWFSNKMGFTFPRGVKIGTAYSEVATAYYKIENPEKSYIYYDVKNVLTDSAKLKAYNKAEEAYIGGKLYKTTTMIEYNYKENPDAYPFVDNSKNIIRYGFNSIMDTDSTLGQWYIDYATANSKVVGVYFHMKGADD